MNTFNFESVAIYHSAAKYPYEAPRQGIYAKLPGTVEFPDEPRYHTALADLEGFDRIWLIFVTSSEGKFSIKIHEELIGKESAVTLVLEDIDGIENGGEFEILTDQIILFPENENYTSDSISLDYQMIRATREESSPQS